MTSIESYLDQLKKELAGADRAIVQDALSDAEEYLRTALESQADPESGATLDAVVEAYGTPAEVAAAYRENEAFISRARPVVKDVTIPAPPSPPAPPDTRNVFIKFFGIYAEPRAWGALLFLLIAFVTGIAYFTWFVTGLSVSVGLLPIIFGIVLVLLFLFSIRGIALMEGKLVEALLGVRMPHRPLFTRRDVGFWGKLKSLLTQRQTWTTMVYMNLQFVLGIFYLALIVGLVSASVWLIGRPVFDLVYDIPAFQTGDAYYYTPAWAMPLVVIGGVLLLTATMHLVKALGQMHGSLAKVMLVRE
jgi:hypothetical protein